MLSENVKYNIEVFPIGGRLQIHFQGSSHVRQSHEFEYNRDLENPVLNRSLIEVIAATIASHFRLDGRVLEDSPPADW